MKPWTRTGPGLDQDWTRTGVASDCMETVQVPGIMDGGRKVGILRSYVEDHPDRLHREGETVLGGADFQPEAPQSYSRKPQCARARAIRVSTCLGLTVLRVE